MRSSRPISSRQRKPSAALLMVSLRFHPFWGGWKSTLGRLCRSKSSWLTSPSLHRCLPLRRLLLHRRLPLCRRLSSRPLSARSALRSSSSSRRSGRRGRICSCWRSSSSDTMHSWPCRAPPTPAARRSTGRMRRRSSTATRWTSGQSGWTPTSARSATRRLCSSWARRSL